MKLDKIKFASLIGFISYRYALTVTQDDMREIDSLIDIEAPVATIQKQDIENLLQAMKKNHKIEAIKAYRAMTGASLLESKNLVEDYWPAPADTRVDRMIATIANQMTGLPGSYTLKEFKDKQLDTIKKFIESFH